MAEKPFYHSNYLMSGFLHTPTRDPNQTQFSVDYVTTRLNNEKQGRYEENARQFENLTAQDTYHSKTARSLKKSRSH